MDAVPADPLSCLETVRAMRSGQEGVPPMEEPTQQPDPAVTNERSQSPGETPDSPPVISSCELTAVPRPVVLSPALPRLWVSVTVLCAILFLVVYGAQLILVASTDRAEFLDAPEEYVEHVMGRDLDLESQAALRPLWEKWADVLGGYEPGDALQGSIEAYQDLSARSSWTRQGRTLAVLLGEAGDQAELAKELDALDEIPSETDFVQLIRYAYLGIGTAPPQSRAILAQVHPAWAQDKLLIRLAQLQGDAAEARAAEEQIESRGRNLYNRSHPLAVAYLGAVAIGCAVVLGWLISGLPSLQVGTGMSPGPWTVGRGAAVMVRAALAGILIELVLSMPQVLDSVPLLKGFYSLIRVLPLLWLGSRYLLQPTSNTLVGCFGLAVPRRSWVKLCLLTIGLTGLELLGSTLITGCAERLGVKSHWSELALEDFLWDPAYIVGLNFFDGVVWAPIFEEIGFRGFLYTTLRSRLPTFWAALVTGLLFGAVHMYTLSGFLAVAWSGLIWSVAYEKSRSLVPGMMAHCFGNILAFGSMVLLYRS